MAERPPPSSPRCCAASCSCSAPPTRRTSGAPRPIKPYEVTTSLFRLVYFVFWGMGVCASLAGRSTAGGRLLPRRRWSDGSRQLLSFVGGDRPSVRLCENRAHVESPPKILQRVGVVAFASMIQKAGVTDPPPGSENNNIQKVDR